MAGSGLLDEPTILSAPASHNWFRFYPNELSRYWRQREVELMARRRAPAWVRYLDVGALHARYMGVRCDGTHFFSWHDRTSPREAGLEEEEYECHPSSGVWDGLVLDALAASLACRAAGDAQSCTWTK